MPAPPEKVQGEPVGELWKPPAPSNTCTNPESAIGQMLTNAMLSMKAVLSPPALFNPWNLIVCDPPVTLNAGVEKFWYDVPEGVKVPTTTPSTSTLKSCRLLPLLPRWAAPKVRTYEPADQLLTDWLN